MANAKSGLTRPSSQVIADLPHYILDRNQAATAAGLIIEKQERRGDRLTTWYRGTEQQWRATPFCTRPANLPFAQSPMYRGFGCFGLPRRGYGGFVLYRKGNDDYRGTSVNEQLPEWIEDAGGGITAYGLPDSVIYVGLPEALLERKIAPPEIETDAWMRAPGDDIFHAGPVIWEYEELPDGRGWFRDFVVERENIARNEAEKKKCNFENTTAMLAYWRKHAWVWLTALSRELSRVETKGGQVFTVTADSLATIQELTDELLDAIQCAQVGVRDAKPANVAQAAALARTDPAFRAFLSQCSG